MGQLGHSWLNGSWHGGETRLDGMRQVEEQCRLWLWLCLLWLLCL